MSPRSDIDEDGRTDAGTTGADSSSDPQRPSDHVDGTPVVVDESDGVTQPKLGLVGSLRFAWRQLTSMRTALFLLMLLALAAIPGSLVPQTQADPNGVVQYKNSHPQLSPVLEKLQVFDTYTSVWFSAIYLLLFISLIGCIVPRTRHHWQALRTRPPRTPARLGRLAGYRSVTISPETVDGDAGATTGLPTVDHAVTTAMTQLRKSGYRVERFGDSVSAERGYLRETGNLVFHAALVGVLLM